MNDVFVYDAVRTPFGKYGGALSGVRPDDLAAIVVRSLMERNPEVSQVGEIVLGNANGAGEDNRNVARMAGLLAGLPVTVPASTVNRLCGSSLDATIAGSRQIALGEADLGWSGVSSRCPARRGWSPSRNALSHPATRSSSRPPLAGDW